MGRSRKIAAGAVAAALGVSVCGAVSDPVWVFTSPRVNRLWETVVSNEVDLIWRWPPDATNASLTVVGMAGTVLQTNLTAAVSNVLWRVCEPGAQPVEEVYDLTLTFLGTDETVVGALTSRLTVVEGAFGTVPVSTDLTEDRWRKIRENAVIPYDAVWETDTAGAATGRLVIARGALSHTVALPYPAGYFGWNVRGGGWGYGVFDLTLDFPETATNTWKAVLTRDPDGTLIRMQ